MKGSKITKKGHTSSPLCFHSTATFSSTACTQLPCAAFSSTACIVTPCSIQFYSMYTVTLCSIQFYSMYTVTLCSIQFYSMYTVTLCSIQFYSMYSYPDLWPLARSAFTQAEEGKYIHMVKQRMPKQSTLFHCICKITYFIVIDGHQQSCVGCNWQLQAEFHRWVCCCCCCCFNMDMTVLSDDFLIFLKNLQ